MAKARITLNDSGPLTFHGRGYDLQRGQAFITSNNEDIVYFGAEQGFTVDMLEGDKPKSVAVVESDDEDDDDAPVNDGAEDDGPADGELSKDELMKLNKGPLLELADEHGVKADATMNKKDIVAAILAGVKKD